MNECYPVFGQPQNDRWGCDLRFQSLSVCVHHSFCGFKHCSQIAKDNSIAVEEEAAFLGLDGNGPLKPQSHHPIQSEK